jgi:hypothetical protein
MAIWVDEWGWSTRKFAALKIRVGDVAQVIECLPSKQEALSSNPNTAKRKHSFEWVCHLQTSVSLPIKGRTRL